MPREPIARDLMVFLAEHVGSVHRLEALLFLRDQADRAFTEDELAGELRSSRESAREALRALEASGLLHMEGGGRARYRPKRPQLADLVERLKATYQVRPVSVVEAIFSAPSRAIRSFADAFKLK